jgi:peroxiredoxin
MSLVIIALAIGWVPAVLAGGLVYRLMADRGRLLLQIEHLEHRFAEVAGPLSMNDPGLPIGAPAPDFELPDLDGRSHTLSQWHGSPIVLVFFDPQCSFCGLMAPRLAGAIRDRKHDQPVPVILTTGEAASNRRVLGDGSIDYPVLLQEGAEVAALFRAQVTPSAYLIDTDGHIASSLAMGADDVLALIQALPSAAGTAGPKPDSAHPQPPVSTRLRSITESKLNRSGLSAGNVAPQFSLPRLDGGELSLSEYQGRRVLLVFSDPDCAPCTILAPQLERLNRQVSDMQVIMVSRGTAEDNQVKVTEHNLTFPIALQRHWEVSRAYGMFATPIAYLIDELGLLESDVAVGNDAILELASVPPMQGEERKEAMAQR